MREVMGWAALAPGIDPALWSFHRRDPGRRDVVLRITHCGVCAGDLHTLDHGDPSSFPLVVGHEMTGTVVEVGSHVSDLGGGDVVAVGSIVGSCRVCGACRTGREQDCDTLPTPTYGGVDRISGGVTQGGFAGEIVVDRHFVHRLPVTLDPAGAAPLLGAGVTAYAPLRHFEVGPRTTVGVIGVGGLGHLAIRFASALGAETVALTSSPSKARAARGLGASDVVVTRDRGALSDSRRRFDLLLDTTGAPLDLTLYFETLRGDGTYVLAGTPPGRLGLDPSSLLVGRRIAGTGSGGVPITREMLEFAARHGIVADVETIRPAELPVALERLRRGDVRFRFVVDMVHAARSAVGA